MSTEQNKELVRSTFAALDTILATHELLYGPDWVGRFPGMPPLDAAGHRQYSEVMLTAFPDLDL